jgi:DNA-directed RNA polymerase II subunit RPB1
MGVMDKDSKCYTCKQGMETCPGHFGHIVLQSPVYHPGLLSYIVKFLRTVCFNCSRVLILKDQDPQKCSEVREILLKIRNAKVRFKTLQKMTGTVNVCSTESGGCGYR